MPRGETIKVTKEEFEELYINQRLSCKLISIKLNCTESNISRLRIGFGIEKIFNREIPLDEEKLKKLVKEGWSQISLASEFKTSTTTIKNRMRTLGIRSCGKPGVQPNSANISTWDKEFVADVIKEPTMAEVKRIVKAKYKVGSKLKGYKIVKYYPNFVQTENKSGLLVGFTYADVWKENLREDKED